MIALLRVRSVAGQMVVDAIALVVAIGLALWARYDFGTAPVPLSAVVALAFAVVTGQVPTDFALWLNRGSHGYGSFQELRALFLAVMGTAVLVGVPVIIAGKEVGLPRSTALLAGPYALVLMAAVRYVHRTLREGARRPSTAPEPTLVFGAGRWGTLCCGP